MLFSFPLKGNLLCIDTLFELSNYNFQNMVMSLMQFSFNRPLSEAMDVDNDDDNTTEMDIDIEYWIMSNYMTWIEDLTIYDSLAIP